MRAQSTKKISNGRETDKFASFVLLANSSSYS